MTPVRVDFLRSRRGFGVGLAVLGHFVPGPLEAALDVEAFVLGGAIEDLLIFCEPNEDQRTDMMTKSRWNGGRERPRIEGGGGRRWFYLVASDLLGNITQGSENVQAEFLSLLIFEHGNVFDVADIAEVANAALDR